MEVRDVERGLSEGPDARPGFLIIPAVAAIFLGVVSVAWNGWAASLPALVPTLVLVPLLWGAIVFGRKRGARRVLEGKSEEARTQAIELDAGGYSIETPIASSRSQWSTLHRYDEGATSFLFFLNPTVKLIIPKRAFRDEDLPRVRELLRKHVTQRPFRSGLARAVILWVVLVIAFLALWQFLSTPERGSTDGQEPASSGALPSPSPH